MIRRAYACLLIAIGAAWCPNDLYAQGTPKNVTLPKLGGIEVGSSRVYVFVGKSGLGHEHAVVGRLARGEIHLGAREAAGELIFDLTTFEADSKEARKVIGLKGESSAATRKQVTQNMLGQEVLNVAKYPEAVFQILSITPAATEKNDPAGTQRYVLAGNFTLHGVEQSIEVPVVVEEQKGWLHVRGNFDIKQSDYGITPISKGLGAIGVADTLRIWGDLWVRPE